MRSFLTFIGVLVCFIRSGSALPCDEMLNRMRPDSTSFPAEFHPLEKGLILDLNADRGVDYRSDLRVEKWINQAKDFSAQVFEKVDEGREVKGSGMPTIKKNIAQINGHNALVFRQQELLNRDEDAFDHLITGTGYTWFCVLKAGSQPGELKDVNSFFGNLRNGGNYEGFWGGLTDSNQVWMGSRNGITFGRWDHNNPRVLSPQRLNQEDYYLLMGQMEAGTGEVTLSLFINDAEKPVSTRPYPVNPSANSSQMAIGQERDAVEHPGVESFVGEIARFLMYERPLSPEELKKTANGLMRYYGIEP